MSLLPTFSTKTLCSLHSKPSFRSPLFFLFYPNPNLIPYSQSPTFSPSIPRHLPTTSFRISASADPGPKPKPKPKGRRRPKPDPPPQGTDAAAAAATAPPADALPKTIPRKPRRGRRSEAAAVEDFVRERLEQTFTSIREQNAGVLEGKEEVLKERRAEEEERKGQMVVEEDDPNWPLDADVGWGIRASEYFEKHPIKNVVEDGVEIDWEGEIDEGWVKEINCLEWESFAFHPSPLVVLVFERYNRAAYNWKLLKELENAAKVYWNAKDRLPPRTIKIDINIEKDLAYALNVKECPELLFLKGNKILYREKEFRTADELVQMIAHFYYNAKRPLWVDAARVSSPF